MSICIEEASPFAVMCAYNRLWGTHCSENRRLLTELLRDEWGFRGLTMTDWGATNDRAAGVAAGMDLEMPGDTTHCRKAILDAAGSGTLPLSTRMRPRGCTNKTCICYASTG